MTAIHSVAGLLPPGVGPASRAAVPRAASHRVGRRARRRRIASASGRDQPRAPRRAVSRRDARVQPARARGARASRSRTAVVRIARAQRTAVFPARFVLDRRDEPVSVRLPGRSAAPVPLHAGRSIATPRGSQGPLRDRIDLTVHGLGAAARSSSRSGDEAEPTAAHPRARRARPRRQTARVADSRCRRPTPASRPARCAASARSDARTERLLLDAADRLGLTARDRSIGSSRVCARSPTSLRPNAWSSITWRRRCSFGVNSRSNGAPAADISMLDCNLKAVLDFRGFHPAFRARMKARRYTFVIADRQTGAVRRLDDLPVADAGRGGRALCAAGARWASAPAGAPRRRINDLQTTNAALQVENASYREATGQLAEPDFRAADGRRSSSASGPRSIRPPSRAMDKLPAIVKSRAMGGSQASARALAPVLKSASARPTPCSAC